MAAEPLARPVTPLLGRGLDAALVGGKGASLDRLIGAGFPVPRSIVVTTDAYRAFVAQPDVAAVLAGLDGRAFDVGADTDVTRAEIDACFVQAPIPHAVRNALHDALSDHAMAGPWAVRSSATAEDLGDASFAGQYESYLDVDAVGLEQAVRLVWASAWYPAPRAYRRFMGVHDDDLAMAVVVMEMLTPSHAGVVFTADPLGSGEAIRIEIVEGLAEQLVSGDVTPEVRLIDRAERDFALDDPPFLPALVELALRAELAMGGPQDIEWAVEHDRVYLVQARPITTTGTTDPTDDGFDIRGAPDATLTTAGVAEMVPGHLCPRLWCLNQPLLEEGFRRLFASLGAADPVLADPDSPLVVRVQGRAALDLDTMKRAVGSIPGGSADELEHQYFGDDDSPTGPAPPQRSQLAAMGQGLRTLKARSDAAIESEITIQTVDRILANEPDLTTLDDEALLALRARVVHFAGRAMAAEMAIAAMAAASYRSVESFVAHHLPDLDPSTVAQEMTAAAPVHHHGGPGLGLPSLDTVARADPVIERATAEPDWSTARGLLATTPDGRRWIADFEASLERSGSTSVFGGPTWREVPELAWLATIHPDTPDTSAVQRAAAKKRIEARLADSQAWRLHRALRGQLVDVRRHFLRREADEAAAFLARRERTKASLLRLGGLVWRLDRELGRRLVASGRIDPDGVEVVTAAEVRALMDGQGPSPKDLAERIRRGHTARDAGPLPKVFVGAPERAPGIAPVGDRLTGWAASPGVYEGPARLVTDVAHSGLRRGDVLVARNTDASWAPLFLLAGAIVVEEGGPLSHAAIVARELGVPAVVNVPGICARVAAATHPLAISVDGSSAEIVVDHRVPTGADGDERDETERTPAAAPSATPMVAAAVVPARRAPSITQDEGAPLGVFVTGLIGAGAVMSALFALTEAVGSTRAERRFDRRARPVAIATSAATIDGIESTAHAAVGLRSMRDHVWLAVVATLTAVIVAVESTVAYADSPPAGWGVVMWAVTLTTSMQFALLALVAGVAAWRWPDVPLVLRRHWPARQWPPDPARRLSGPAISWAIALAGAFVALMMMHLWLPDALTSPDGRLYDLVGASRANERFGPEWLGWFGRPRAVIPMAVGIGLGSLRCRPLSLLFPLSIVVAGTINVAMAAFVRRQRPPGASDPTALDSFPGGHILTVTLLAGVLPLTVHVMTGRRMVAVATRIAATAAGLVLIVDQVRQGGHWPTDHIAGACIGIAGVLVIHAVVAMPAAHEHCHQCPWGSRSGAPPT